MHAASRSQHALGCVLLSRTVPCSRVHSLALRFATRVSSRVLVSPRSRAACLIFSTQASRTFFLSTVLTSSWVCLTDPCYPCLVLGWGRGRDQHLLESKVFHDRLVGLVGVGSALLALKRPLRLNVSRSKRSHPRQFLANPKLGETWLRDPSSIIIGLLLLARRVARTVFQ